MPWIILDYAKPLVAPRLPPPQCHLKVAARRRFFMQSAQELNVQQPSASASFKLLEGTLDVSLFQRQHRRISLTHAGDRLSEDVIYDFKFEKGSRPVLVSRYLTRLNTNKCETSDRGRDGL